MTHRLHDRSALLASRDGREEGLALSDDGGDGRGHVDRPPNPRTGPGLKVPTRDFR